MRIIANLIISMVLSYSFFHPWIPSDHQESLVDYRERLVTSGETDDSRERPQMWEGLVTRSHETSQLQTTMIKNTPRISREGRGAKEVYFRRIDDKQA